MTVYMAQFFSPHYMLLKKIKKIKKKLKEKITTLP